MSGILTIICNKEGKLYSIIKPGGTYLQEKKIIECIHIAKGRAEQIFQLLHSS
jgi:exosome complex RNA-binding protein Rrp42 (RNase PH superfamily)